tara:strand:- start:2472 stop:2786 length:315 start_codon:yes stop_codon:yes gene_type:complete
MPKKKESFFEKQWVKLTGVIVGISALISIGYAFGTYKAEVSCKIDQMKLIQEYNEKIKSEDYLCKTETILGIRKEIGKLKEVTNRLNQPKKEETKVKPKTKKDE